MPSRSLFVLLALSLLASCSRNAAEPQALWYANDLLVLDADAGDVDENGEPRSVIFRCETAGDGWNTPELVVRDPRWRDAVSMAYGPDNVLYVVDSEGSHRGQNDASRGGVFAVSPDGNVSLVWTHADARQPVHIAYDADSARVFITDRSADPLALGRATGAVFIIDVAPGTPWPEGRVLASAHFVTPAAVCLRDGRAWMLDADANPDEHPGTPGMIFALDDDMLEATEAHRFANTTSPIGFAGEWIVDANFVMTGPRIGAGALITNPLFASDVTVAVTHEHFPPRTFVDPTCGVTLPDGRLALADANADPGRFGHDNLGRGVYGSGRGCVLALDLAAGELHGEVIAVSEQFVTPIAVVSARD